MSIHDTLGPTEHFVIDSKRLPYEPIEVNPGRGNLAGVTHQWKPLVMSIHNTWGPTEHFIIDSKRLPHELI